MRLAGSGVNRMGTRRTSGNAGPWWVCVCASVDFCRTEVDLLRPRWGTLPRVTLTDFDGLAPSDDQQDAWTLDDRQCRVIAETRRLPGGRHTATHLASCSIYGRIVSALCSRRHSAVWNRSRIVLRSRHVMYIYGDGWSRPVVAIVLRAEVASGPPDRVLSWSLEGGGEAGRGAGRRGREERWKERGWEEKKKRETDRQGRRGRRIHVLIAARAAAMHSRGVCGGECAHVIPVSAGAGCNSGHFSRSDWA